MTMLDDYEAKYKLRGVKLVSQLLEVSPPDLLRRTGIDSLIMSVSSLVFVVASLGPFGRCVHVEVPLSPSRHV